MIEKFRDIKLSKANKKKLDYINDIIKEYQDAGYIMTLRQLYYQLVSRDVIPNEHKEYAKLSNLLKEGRMGGIVDWEAIEDRTRQMNVPLCFDDPQERIDTAIKWYRRDRQENQEVYVEVWVEKDALSGVLKVVTEKYGIPIMVNRGYSSASAMYSSFQRFRSAYFQHQKVIILYIGDYDPSGIDMIRDISTRISEFAEGYFKPNVTGKYLRPFDFTINPIALTEAQIKTYKPPKNPAKRSDPRAKKFIEERGKSSWEVDALPPDVLNNILEKAILAEIDVNTFLMSIEQEKQDKEKLRDLKKYL
jgi:hypothetical protein